MTTSTVEVIRQYGVGSLHRKLCLGLVVERGAVLTGWADWLRMWHRAVNAPTGLDEDEYLPRALYGGKQFVPDAWRVDVTPQSGPCEPMVVVTCWEVEVTNPLSRVKHEAYGMLWGDLDAMDYPITVALRTVDQHGVEREVDLMSAYYDAFR